MSEWVSIDEIGELKPGDVIQTPSKAPDTALILPGMMFPMVSHFGVVVEKDGKLQIAHNPIFGKPVIQSFEEVFSDRPITRVLRTNVSNDILLYRFSQCTGNGYRFVDFNCEDAVRFMVQPKDETEWPVNTPWIDQRSTYFLIALSIIVLLIVYLSKKSQ